MPYKDSFFLKRVPQGQYRRANPQNEDEPEDLKDNTVPKIKIEDPETERYLAELIHEDIEKLCVQLLPEDCSPQKKARHYTEAAMNNDLG